MRPSDQNQSVRAADKQARILASAEELFCTGGYDGTSARDIARHAGVPKAVVFYHFGSKDALFERVMERYYAAHTEALQGAGAEGSSRRERLHAMVDSYIDFMRENRRYARLVQREMAGDNPHTGVMAKNIAILARVVAAELDGITPEGGPFAARQVFLTFSAAVINFFTYAPQLRDLWDVDADSDEAISVRRAHVHWLTDLMLNDLYRTAPPECLDEAS